MQFIFPFSASNYFSRRSGGLLHVLAFCQVPISAQTSGYIQRKWSSGGSHCAVVLTKIIDFVVEYIPPPPSVLTSAHCSHFATGSRKLLVPASLPWNMIRGNECVFSGPFFQLSNHRNQCISNVHLTFGVTHKSTK